MSLLIDKTKNCCFTGHRTIPDKDAAMISSYTTEVIENLADMGYTTFISGGAIGFDLLAARIVLQLKTKYPQLRLVMALPCKNQDAKWNMFQKRQYRSILDNADEVICLNEEYCTGCMYQRNRFMVDNSFVCIAYMTHTSGGTAHTVRYAEERELGVVNVAQFI